MEFTFTPDIPRYWSAADPARTHFANAFSVLLPEYERLFIATIAPRIGELDGASAELKAQAKTFCAQEGQHAAVHRSYNRWLLGLGYAAVPAFERAIARLLRGMERRLSKRLLLALTAGGEHITSFMAGDYLSHPEKWTEGSDPVVAGLWQWHAAEEIEHKSVCFDVYQSLAGDLWLRRLAYLAALLQTTLLAGTIQLYLLWKDGLLFKRSTWEAQYRLLFGPGGFLRGLLVETGKYLRKEFHPWDTRDGDLAALWEQSTLIGRQI